MTAANAFAKSINSSFFVESQKDMRRVPRLILSSAFMAERI